MSDKIIITGNFFSDTTTTVSTPLIPTVVILAVLIALKVYSALLCVWSKKIRFRNYVAVPEGAWSPTHIHPKIRIKTVGAQEI